MYRTVATKAPPSCLLPYFVNQPFAAEVNSWECNCWSLWAHFHSFAQSIFSYLRTKDWKPWSKPAAQRKKRKEICKISSRRPREDFMEVASQHGEKETTEGKRKMADTGGKQQGAKSKKKNKRTKWRDWGLVWKMIPSSSELSGKDDMVQGGSRPFRMNRIFERLSRHSYIVSIDEITIYLLKTTIKVGIITALL